MVKLSVVISYIFSSVICGALILLSVLLFQFQRNSKLTVLRSFSDSIIYFLFWILLGLVIIIAVSVVEKYKKAIVIDMLVSALITSSFMIYVGSKIKTSMEGLSVIFGLAGLIIGIMVSLIAKLISNFMNSAK